MRVTGILLAAGFARRFGANKLVATLGDGTPVVVATARRLAAAVDDTLAVVPGTAGAVEALLHAEGIAVARCAAAADGMGHSLACGVRAAAASDAWLVMLGDMPFVAPATLARLVATLRAGAAIVVPSHAGADGHPVGFAARFAAELADLDGDRGARALLTRHAALVQRVDVTDPGIHRDIDVPADLDGS
ncbi:MAG: nucleotidyltransferase family protein [Gammaproteobacteria bacterium]